MVPIIHTYVPGVNKKYKLYKFECNIQVVYTLCRNNYEF